MSAPAKNGVAERHKWDILADNDITLQRAGKVAFFCCWTVPGLLVGMPLVQTVLTMQTGPTGPPPADVRTVGLAIAFIALRAAIGFARSGAFVAPSSRHSWLLGLLCVVHFGGLASTAILQDSAKQASKGVHQRYGNCTTEETDFAGTRFVYVCEERHLQTWGDFQFRCLDRMDASDGMQWYTICGTPQTTAWTQDALCLTAICAAVFFAVGCIVPLIWHNDGDKEKVS